MDQSGSMATSLIYGGIMGAILASMPAVETHVVAFNHEEVVDLTEHCTDPVDLLFGVQLGGAEDYWKATSYCERFMHTPAKTLYILIADLHDTSPNENRFVKKMEFLLESGLRAVTLLAISDQGQPSFNADLAGKLSKLGMPCFGCTPDRLPDLLAAVLKGQDLQQFAENVRLKSRRSSPISIGEWRGFCQSTPPSPAQVEIGKQSPFLSLHSLVRGPAESLGFSETESRGLAENLPRDTGVSKTVSRRRRRSST